MKGLVYLAAGIAIGMMLAAWRAQAPAPVERVIVRHDTVAVAALQPSASRSAVRRVAVPIAPAPAAKDTATILVSDSAGAAILISDSAGAAGATAVSLPIEQAYYADTLFEAWVSGFMPSLDSLRLRVPTIETRLSAPAIQTRQSAPSRPKRWHLGITAGAALTPHGPQPYLGIGLTYSLLSF